MNATCLHHITTPNPLFSPQNHFQTRRLRHYRRRRLKTSRKFAISVHNGSNFLDPFQNFLSQFPSPTSVDFLAPVIGLASGLTLYLSKFKSDKSCTDVGEWILFTSPTPFNRFVLLRCPSISFEGSELLEDVNEKLVQEERHFVKLNSGRILVRSGGEEIGGGWEEKLEYQRVCVSTEDGGVISLDWPANLDLEKEHGLDTTLLLVPGTAKGSMDENVRSFVCEALKRGLFPVVMNPRGCAGSPLTTARLFTAADSDDICLAVQFINKARPWTTLMSVAWGYGANMLTKYLAEFGEKTPLTAATCINNPFDLEEATRCSPYHLALDQKLTGGLIDILRSNKELFRGRAKGFDVERALLANSVRDFEKAISMVSYGFEEIEDFYSKSSTQSMVGNVKIPVLFIQNDDGTVPLFSIPRSLIAENPFTSLLLCSCLPSDVIASSRAAVSWCQNLTIEWLTAVELGLLKGRHPFLKDVDVTINPSEGLALLEARQSDKGVKLNKLIDSTLNDATGYAIDHSKEMFEDGSLDLRHHSRSRQDLLSNLELKEGIQKVGNGVSSQTSPVDAELMKEEDANPEDAERGQVLQTAQVVMNMLDVTMPGTLSEEEKKKVLIAVGQGETLMTALQDAVPEDVREKLKTAVSGILQAQNMNLKFDGLKIPDVSSGIKAKIQEKNGVSSSVEDVPKDTHSSDQIKRTNDYVDNYDHNQPGSDKSGSKPESDLCTSENSQQSIDSGQTQETSSQQSDTSGSVRKEANESGNESNEFIKEKAALFSDSGEKGLETGTKPNFASSEKSGSAVEAIADEYKADQDGGAPQQEPKREGNTQKNEEKPQDFAAGPNKTSSGNIAEDAVLPSGSSPDSQPVERECNDNQKRENKSLQPVDQNKPPMSDSSAPSFSVAQALDALTGMDDSTQVAVNSVFGVIEEMIDQLEQEKESENKTKDSNEVEDESIYSASEKDFMTIDNHPLEMKESGKNELNVQSDVSQDCLAHKHHENGVDPREGSSTEWVEEPAESPIFFSGNATNGSQGTVANNYKSKGAKKDQLIGSKLLADHSDSHINNRPLYAALNPREGFLHNEYFRSYLLSKMPKTKPLDLDTTTALLLDYFPEEGQWKLLEQAGNVGESFGEITAHYSVDRTAAMHSSAKVNVRDNYIEPTYVVLDAEKQQEPVGEYNAVDNFIENVENSDDRLEEMMHLVKETLLDALNTEVGRKLSAADMKRMEPNLGRDMEQVANAVSLAIEHDKGFTWLSQEDYNSDHTSEKFGTLNGEHIIKAISSAVLSTSYLRRVLPIGVIIGSSLAALRRYFDVASSYDNGLTSLYQNKEPGEKSQDKSSIKKIVQKKTTKTDQMIRLNNTRTTEGEDVKLKSINKDSVMVGAVTAALGASALLVHQQSSHRDKENAESSSKSFNEMRNYLNPADKLDESKSEKVQNNIVTSLAEKAMSVASPVVPTNEDGEVDQERLVAMLADLAQRGGFLRLVGKIALLWGGIRGAMSLTDRLILFLQMAERPFYQRILGFVGMVIVVWSPVVVPLLPTLVQGWMTGNPSKFAELVCIVGLYTAVMILVMLWGRRIRGYENPLKQYGLDLTTLPKIQSSLMSLIGGVVLVLAIHFINASLGCVSFSWPSSLPSSSLDAMTCVKVLGKIIKLACQGIFTATSVALVEELLFRSWLPEEIATDLGFHRGIIISGFAFSLIHRSLLAAPGLWLLSLVLSGLRERSQGSLSVPIGLRVGIMASSFVLQTGGFLTYKPDFPLWVTGSHPLQPFSGVVGLALPLFFAIILYPTEPQQKKEGKRIRQE